MTTEQPDNQGNSDVEITPDIPLSATVVKQSSWAWQLSAVPWLLLVAAGFFFDFISFNLLPIVFAVILVLPRYISWRKSAYILGEEFLVYDRSVLFSSQRIIINYSELIDIQTRPGMFGKTLGYMDVYLVQNDDKIYTLPYVPIKSPLLDHVTSRISPPDKQAKMPKKTTVAAENKDEVTIDLSCDSCGNKDIKAGSGFCNNCGSKLSV